jgi:hypothetical protein
VQHGVCTSLQTSLYFILCYALHLRVLVVSAAHSTRLAGCPYSLEGAERRPRLDLLALICMCGEGGGELWAAVEAMHSWSVCFADYIEWVSCHTCTQAKRDS